MNVCHYRDLKTVVWQLTPGVRQCSSICLCEDTGSCKMQHDWQHQCLTGFTKSCEAHSSVPVPQSWAQQFRHTCVLSSHLKSLLFQHVCSIYLCREYLSVISLPKVRLWPQVDKFLPTHFLTTLLPPQNKLVSLCLFAHMGEGMAPH